MKFHLYLSCNYVLTHIPTVSIRNNVDVLTKDLLYCQLDFVFQQVKRFQFHLIKWGRCINRYKLNRAIVALIHRFENYIVFEKHIQKQNVRNYYTICDTLLHPIEIKHYWASFVCHIQRCHHIKVLQANFHIKILQ